MTVLRTRSAGPRTTCISAVLWHGLQTCARLVEEIKKGSSKWMKAGTRPVAGFAWQNGYGAFWVGEGQLSAVKEYIRRQPEHHATVSFKDELRELLRRHGITYDGRYLWD